MPRNVFSRFVQTSARGRSFYEDLRAREDDVEDRAGLLDEENLNQEFHDHDLENVEGLDTTESRATLDGRGPHAPPSHRAGRPRWSGNYEDVDNDVPASLLVERNDEGGGLLLPGQNRNTSDRHRPAVPGLSTGRSREQWDVRQAQPALHPHEYAVTSPPRAGPGGFMAGLGSRSAKNKAEWRWASVSNLDMFMKDVYDYYQACGFWCIMLERGLHLIHVIFVAVFLTFLTQCIDYPKLRGSTKLSQVMVPQCTQNMSGLWNVGLWLFTFYTVWKTIQNLLDVRRLLQVRDFYSELLNIPEHDMQTVTWQEVVRRIMDLRDHNPKTATSLSSAQRRFLGSQSKERLDASDIANRLMRRENYLIALFNKDILDLTVPLPFLQNKQFLCRTLEWTLEFAILDFVFNENGQVNQEFLKSDRRGELSSKLRARFLFAAGMSLMFAPILALYNVIVHVLTQFNEWQRNPSTLSMRGYTLLAEWKFREFNELPHLFRKRVNMSYPYATHFVEQFPKLKAALVARTVAFIAGSLGAVLAIVSIIDSEMFLGFEISPERTVLFYLGLLGSVWAYARGVTSEDSVVFDPDYAMRNVIEYTHYQPDHWQDRLHSYEVKMEFAELYKLKLQLFVEEIIGILMTPLILFVSLPKTSDQIIDFFREFTIHVDGLGYVCSFAEFDFKKGIRNARKPGGGGAADIRDDYYSTKHGKMEMSYYGFLGNYGNYHGTAKSGPQSHLPPNMRHPFHPPPAWPSMLSPTHPTDMQFSRMGRSERARSRATAKTPRFGPVIAQPSPLASILLDPHHQPPPSATSSNRPRQPKGGYAAEGDIIEEGMEDGAEESEEIRITQEEGEPYENGGVLDESMWQTSPSKLSRESSATASRKGPDAGVVTMIKQFNQAQLNRRPGVVR